MNKNQDTNEQPPIREEVRKIMRNLKKIRSMLGWSQQNVADELGITQRHYGRIENGEVDISLSMLYNICDVYKIDISVLMNLQPSVFYANITGKQEHSHNTFYNSTDVKHIQDLYERLVSEKNKIIEEKERIIHLLSGNKKLK